MSRRIFSDWKEISGHTERSVRTAPRWESQAWMPAEFASQMRLLQEQMRQPHRHYYHRFASQEESYIG